MIRSKKVNTTQVIHLLAVFPCQIATWVVFSRQIATLSVRLLCTHYLSLCLLSTLHPPSNSATIMQKTTHYPPMHIHPNITEYILNIANSQYPNLTAYFSLCLCCPSKHICTFASPLFSATIMCEQLDAEVHIYPPNITQSYHNISILQYPPSPPHSPCFHSLREIFSTRGEIREEVFTNTNPSQEFIRREFVFPETLCFP